VLSCTPAGSAVRAEPAAAVLSVATWNIRHGRPRRGLTSNRWLAIASARLDVDILAAQEVEQRLIRSWFADQARLVASAAGQTDRVYAPARRLAWVGRDGIMLAVRGTLADATVMRFRGMSGRQDRVAVLARATIAGGAALSVACAHLENSPDARHQLTELVAALVARPAPRVLLGDFNLCADDVAGIVIPAGFALAGGGPTEPAWAPHQRIDHVAADGVRPGAVTTPMVPVSDHRPLVVELDVVTPAASVSAGSERSAKQSNALS
jgi:endonuclease/exonuclease/phosphatase family metal-dependent hydrolase